MKKDTLYEIYSLLKDNTTQITDSLYKLMLLNNNSEEIFLKFCRNNSVNEETFDYFIDMSASLGDLSTPEEQDELTNLIIEISNDDYIVNNEDYLSILEKIILMLDEEYINIFDVYDSYEHDYYKAIIIKEFIRFLQTMKKIDMSMIYEHDIKKVIASYTNVVNDLYNTTSNNMEIDVNTMYLDRIKYYIDIISDKDIYELDDDKYTVVLSACQNVQNIEELKSLKNKIKIYRAKDLYDFILDIDGSTSDLSEMTIEIIRDELGYKRFSVPKKSMGKIKKMLGFKPKDVKTVTTREVDDPNKELDIIKKILKPLD